MSLVKPISLDVTYHSVGKFYQVQKIVNSVYYKPGENIPEAQMESICANPGWTVTIINYDYLAILAALLGVAISATTAKAGL